MIKYVKCPRCELNYIDPEKQEYCDVCIAEMKGNKLQFADLDDEELDEELEEETSDICPVCGVNHVRFGETMCDACKEKSELDEEESDSEHDEEWQNYLEETDDMSLEDAQLDEELKEELEEDSENEENEEDSENEDEDDDFDDELDDFDDDDGLDEDDDFDDDDEDEDDEDDLF